MAAGEADAQEASLALSAEVVDQDLVVSQAVPLTWATRRLQRDHQALFTTLGMGQTRRAIYQDDYKLIQAGAQHKLFNWRNDPAEAENVCADEPELLAHMQSALQTAFERPESAQSGLTQQEIDPQVMERLRELGYLE